LIAGDSAQGYLAFTHILQLGVAEYAAAHVVVQSSTGQCSFEHGFVLQIRDFISGVGEIGLGIGKIIAESLGVIVLTGYWVCSIDVVWVDI
jgi:hypothetical protein